MPERCVRDKVYLCECWLHGVLLKCLHSGVSNLLFCIHMGVHACTHTHTPPDPLLHKSLYYKQGLSRHYSHLVCKKTM